MRRSSHAKRKNKPSAKRPQKIRKRGNSLNPQRKILFLKKNISYVNPMNLAQKIQISRKARGMTQEELAAALNVSHQSISKWESSQTMPGLDKILLLSEYFGVSTDYLLKGNVENGESPAPAPPSSQPVVTMPKSRYWLYLGLLLTAAGCAGVLSLWTHALVNPPYTFGKTLNNLEMFSFYIRYNEVETWLTFAVGTMLAGIGAVLSYRFRRNIGMILSAIKRRRSNAEEHC